ncbi:MAG TPA: hypothetical protein VE944_19205 [Nostoc sp.]|nr:hypothetical protein [Nostoc sp.]HYX16452.1 hypothetical protein [Nostoc sp.]
MEGSRSVFLIAIKFTTLRHFYAEADHVCDRVPPTVDDRAVQNLSTGFL